VKTVQLGNSGAQVSSMCLGAMWFGTRNDQETSFRLLDHYVEAGGRFIDTANIYAYAPQMNANYRGGESEIVLGDWFKVRNKRADMFIATKLGFPYVDAQRGLRASQIEAECHKSLRRMGIETIDLYYAHVDDRNTRMVETLEAFSRLVGAGKVRYIGASNFLAWRLEEARWVSRTHGWPEYCCIQQRYSYLRPRPGTSFDPQIAANDDLLDYCTSRGITMLAYSPLLNGVYTRSDRTFPRQYVGQDSDSRLAVLKTVAQEVGATANQVVLAWMMQGDPYVIPVIGATTTEQLAQNLGALQVKLSADQVTRLNEAGG
jgi:aryl-alcohol dehydrogenase-like predicted oxidoreductase